MINTILDIPANERNIIRIGKFKKIESSKSINQKKSILGAGAGVLASRSILGLFNPLLVTAVVGVTGVVAVSSLIKANRQGKFDYLNVPSNQALNLLEWNYSVPERDKLYIRHPHKQKEYLYAKDFHKILFEEKYNEAIRILMTLQPKELTVEHLQGYSSEINAGVSGQKSGTGGTGSFSYKNGNGQRILFNAQFRKPSQPRPEVLPQDLIWYPFEKRWSSIVEGVIKHNLESVEMDINYNDDYGIGADLQGSIVDLVGGGAEAKYTKFLKTHWNIKAKFW